MRTKHHIKRVARVTLQFTTPFHVGTGQESGASDAGVVTDMNGLPAIPGSSLAGVLRSAFKDAYTPGEAEYWFGYQKGGKGDSSRISVSWACIHNSENIPVEGLLKQTARDVVLENALCPTLRDHVRINDKGVSDSDEKARFDELCVCAGHRFTFELEMEADQEEAEESSKVWTSLLCLLRFGGLRIGGKTCRGLGSFDAIGIWQREFDLSTKADFADYCRYPVRLSDRNHGLNPWPGNNDVIQAAESVKSVIARRDAVLNLPLQPEGFWMFGDADQAPVRDSLVEWKNDRGSVKPDLVVVPGSAVKGALSHRTAFHYNRRQRLFAGNPKAKSGTANAAVNALFGSMKGRNSADSRRGRVLIDDVFLPEDPPERFVQHVALSQFTGAALDGLLFNERPFWKLNDKQELPLCIRVVDVASIKTDHLDAFRDAILDLVNGNLQMGAGSGRGNGFFRGDAESVSLAGVSKEGA